MLLRCNLPKHYLNCLVYCFVLGGWLFSFLTGKRIVSQSYIIDAETMIHKNEEHMCVADSLPRIANSSKVDSVPWQKGLPQMLTCCTAEHGSCGCQWPAVLQQLLFVLPSCDRPNPQPEIQTLETQEAPVPAPACHTRAGPGPAAGLVAILTALCWLSLDMSISNRLSVTFLIDAEAMIRKNICEGRAPLAGSKDSVIGVNGKAVTYLLVKAK